MNVYKNNENDRTDIAAYGDLNAFLHMNNNDHAKDEEQPQDNRYIMTRITSQHNLKSMAMSTILPSPSESNSKMKDYRMDLNEKEVEEKEKHQLAVPMSTAFSLTISTRYASAMEVNELLDKLRVKPGEGLNDMDVISRRKLVGHNSLKVNDRKPVYYKFFEQFRNPLILLLLASAIVSIIMHQYDDAFSITLAILIVVTVAFVQEWRSEKTLESLNELVPHTCHCLRQGGQLLHIDASDLVPGDIIQLIVGDRIPADVRVITAIDLEVDESNLTGETKPAKKNAKVVIRPELDHRPVDCMKNIAFMGTLVRNGYGTGLVVSTGEHSEFGKVFKMMKSVEERKTPLQINMDQLGKQLSIFSFIIIGIIMLLGMTQRRSMMDMFTISVSLAVAAIPEGLPIVVTVTLALGVMRMAKRKAIVKRLPSVESLGSVNVICADKTGTLTYNKMRLTKVYSVNNNQVYDIRQQTEEHFVLMSGLSILELAQVPSLMDLFRIGNLCNNGYIDQDSMVGQPTELALLMAGIKLGMMDRRSDYERISVIPFSSEKKWMAIQCKKINTTEDAIYYAKGATEILIKRCINYQSSTEKVAPITPQIIDLINTTASDFAAEGLRVLALAQGKDLDQLTFVGLAGIHDPPKLGVAEVIRRLILADIRVVMITGDSKETAASIANRLNICPFVNDRAFMSGHDLERLEAMNVAQLHATISSVYVFYRAEPRHKLSIVKAFQANGATVAMTGDGVNDAPALKSADIGIAMGLTGTDVSKEAADMIILDDNFSTILAAIEEGKSIFCNIKHFLQFQLSTSIAALILVAIATLFNMPNPLNAMQILWINIIMDGPPAQSLGVEPVDADIMKLPPRNRNAPILTKHLILRSIISAFIIVCGTMYVFKTEANDGIMTSRDTTMTFTTFVMFNMFNAMSCRSDTKSLFSIGVFSNRMLLLAIIFSLIGQVCVIYVPFFQSIFLTEALSPDDLLFITILASTVLWINEIIKMGIRRLKVLHKSKEKDAMEMA